MASACPALLRTCAPAGCGLPGTRLQRGGWWLVSGISGVRRSSVSGLCFGLGECLAASRSRTSLEHEVSHISVLPWHIPMLQPLVAPNQRPAASWPASPGELGSLQERGPAPAPIYVLAVCDVWAGRDPIGPGAGSGGHGGGRGRGPPLPSLHAQSAPALCGCLSPRDKLRATSPTLQL